MKLKLFILLLFFINIVVAQKKKQMEFVENITDYTTKKDSLPFFVYQKEELDTFIALNRIIPPSSEIYGVKCEVHLGFKVDKKNNIGNFKHYKTDIVLPQNIQFNDYSQYDTLKLTFQKESERLLELTHGLWFSDSIKEKNEIRIKFYFISEAFQSLNKDLQMVNAYKFKYGNATSFIVKKELYNYGVKKYQLKKTHLAKLYFEQSIVYFPKDIDAHYNLASCYLKLKDNEKACKHWNKCLELGDESVKKELTNYCK